MGYNLGTWDDSNVPNVGYVAYLLNNYYPNMAQPAGLADDNQQAAAVQAAIWYFSDNYVLTDGDRPAPGGRGGHRRRRRRATAPS